MALSLPEAKTRYHTGFTALRSVNVSLITAAIQISFNKVLVSLLNVPHGFLALDVKSVLFLDIDFFSSHS